MSVQYLSAQHTRTEHWQNRNARFIREADTLKTGRIIFLGNSITEGFDLPAYFPVSRPVNRGIKGDHTDGVLERLQSSVLKPIPSAVFLMIGINDIGAGDADSIILGNYRQILERIRSALPYTRIYVHSILPTTSRWSNCPKEKINRLNEQIARLAVKNRCDWVDIHPLFTGPDGYLRPELTSDGLHLNEAGYRLWTGVLREKGLQ